MTTASRSFSKGVLLSIAALVALLAGALVAGYLPRHATTDRLAEQAAQRNQTPPLVNAANVTLAPVDSEASFPGSVTPITEAYIYARASGYLKRRYVDIGDRVRAGQLLAEIDAPDLDQEVIQAQAMLSQSEGQLGQAEAALQQLTAGRDLAKITWERYRILTKTGAVSRQAGDAQFAAAQSAEASVAAGEKNVVAARDYVRASKAKLDRLATLQRYERVTAPFDGIITARNVDVGALISATGEGLGPGRPNSAGPSDVPAGGEIFRLAQIGSLRVLVSLPQSESPSITVGQTATVSVEQFPRRSFPGCIARTSSSLDAASRTLLVEVHVSNPTGALLPGMYANVDFTMHRTAPPFLVPDASLVVNADGTSVAVLAPLTPDDLRHAVAGGIATEVTARFRMVRYRKVRVGRDYGKTVEVFDGVQSGDTVAVSPGDAVREGALVQIAGARP